jgi:hypothetical protein
MKHTTHSIRGFACGLGVAIGLAALAAPVTIPNVFTAGTPARAADVNANFNAVATAHNDTDARVTALDAEIDANLNTVTTAHSDTTARVNALEAVAREPNLQPSGNLVLGPSNPSSGNILKDSQPFIHNFGDANVFVGVSAGNFSTSAVSTVAVGDEALNMVTSGRGNTAVGTRALHRATTGDNNIAVGADALRANTSGSRNVGVGTGALLENTTGSSNTAVGQFSIAFMVRGTGNTAIGYGSGFELRDGSDNIYLAHGGASNESSTLRIGTVQTRAFIAGIRGSTTGSTNAVPVVIDENGQLGTVVSSRRFKENIADMGDASSLLMRLRPVTFHYRDDRNPAGAALQYGLIAEEVASVAPGLVAHAADGEVETVFYEFLPPMLLNELQKQQRSLDAQKARIAGLENTIAVLAQQAHRTAALLARHERSQAAN